MAEFIAIVTRDLEGFSEADFAPLMEPEAEQARALYAQGILRQIWSRKNPLGAILVLEAASADEARAHVMSLPLAAKGMLKIVIEAVGPYRGFGPRA